MSILSVTSRGQVTLRKEVLQHLDIKPGEKIEIDLLPDGRAALRAATGAAFIGHPTCCSTDPQSKRDCWCWTQAEISLTGVIAYEGRWLRGDTFFSFDKKAVALLAAQGQAARLP